MKFLTIFKIDFKIFYLFKRLYFFLCKFVNSASRLSINFLFVPAAFIKLFVVTFCHLSSDTFRVTLFCLKTYNGITFYPKGTNFFLCRTFAIFPKFLKFIEASLITKLSSVKLIKTSLNREIFKFSAKRENLVRHTELLSNFFCLLYCNHAKIIMK